MTLAEWEDRESKRFGMIAAALAGVAVLQGLAGRWWLVVLAAVLALLHAAVAAASWHLSKRAEPWQDPDPKRPRRWEPWVDGGLACLMLVDAFASLLDRRPIDAVSWLLAAWTMWIHYRRDRERQRLTEPPPKPSARLGPPMEWID